MDHSELDLAEAKEILGGLHSRVNRFTYDHPLWETLDALIEKGYALSEEEIAESRAELERMVRAEEASGFELQAYEVAVAAHVASHNLLTHRFAQMFEAYGRQVVATWMDADYYGTPQYPRMVDAFEEALHRAERRQVRVRPSVPQARPSGHARRSTRPRAVRQRRQARAPDRPADEPPLADLARRCPRCGSLARPLLPTALWTCDYCADQIREQHIQHQLTRLLVETDQILRGGLG